MIYCLKKSTALFVSYLQHEIINSSYTEHITFEEVK